MDSNMSMISCFIIIISFFGQGIYGQVTPPGDTTVALGADVFWTCTSAETNPVFTWGYVTAAESLYVGTTRATNVPRYDNIVLLEGTDPQTSILNINDIELEEDGEYLCSTTTVSNTPPSTIVTVEVASQSQPIDLINIDNFANYQATCDAIRSKPEETITWVLDGVTQTNGVEETDPGISSDPLFDKRSVFTFPATLENYNVMLTCQIGGHLLDSLNREETRRVDVQSPPASAGITVSLSSDRNQLTITCNTNEAVYTAIPAMSNYYIYDSNNTLLHMSTNSLNSVTIAEPEQETEYTCVGGNYLGNTTGVTDTYSPFRTSTHIWTTESEPFTTDGTTLESPGAVADTCARRCDAGLHPTRLPTKTCQCNSACGTKYCCSDYRKYCNDCGGKFTSGKRYLHSPRVPKKFYYPHNTDCSWTITVERNHIVAFTFLSFYFQGPPGCSHDYVKLHDGRDESSPLLLKHCGEGLPVPATIYSSGNKMYVHMHSDESVSNTGFTAVFYTGTSTHIWTTESEPLTTDGTTLESTGTTTHIWTTESEPFTTDGTTSEYSDCGGKFTSEKGVLVIHSPIAPNTFNYPHNTDCSWTITVKKNHRVAFTFKTFYLEDSFGCGHDYVKLHDGRDESSPLLLKHCGVGLPVPATIYSSGNNMYVHMHSDESVSNFGFVAVFYTGGEIN